MGASREASVSPPPDATATDVSETLYYAVRKFGRYPYLHGMLLVRSGARDEVTYDLWVREPAFRVSVVGDSEIDPWVSDDGQSSNLDNYEVQFLVLYLTDPRYSYPQCEDARPLGEDEVLGRPVLGFDCDWGGKMVTLWVDDETGLILAGDGRIQGRSMTWEFTMIEWNPEFPTAIFEAPGR